MHYLVEFVFAHTLHFFMCEMVAYYKIYGFPQCTSILLHKCKVRTKHKLGKIKLLHKYEKDLNRVANLDPFEGAYRIQSVYTQMYYYARSRANGSYYEAALHCFAYIRLKNINKKNEKNNP